LSLNFLSAFWIESPSWTFLSNKILNMFISRCQCQNSRFSFYLFTTWCFLWVQPCEYGWNCSGLNLFSRELLTCVIHDAVKHSNLIVRTEGSLFLPHLTNTALNSSSLKQFHDIRGNVRTKKHRGTFAKLFLPWKSNKYYYVFWVGEWVSEGVCVCVSVTLVIQQENCLRHIIVSFVVCLALPYFSTLKHKRKDFLKKKSCWE
jgi:hypothetical protein